MFGIDRERNVLVSCAYLTFVLGPGLQYHVSLYSDGRVLPPQSTQ
jgi:hypothetical protein